MAEQREMPGVEVEQDEKSLIDRDLGNVPEYSWAPQLAQLVSVLEAMHCRQGRDEEEAFRLARDAVIEIAEYHGGRHFYLPKGERLRVALRDAEIHHRWQRKAPIMDLAREYGLSDVHLYRIINSQRKLHLRKTQGRLFNDKGELA